ncbi:hypothetical protein [Neolewinella persica]|uniref:hypothetical protein n=1 Tax=Neolewinella persica TaxID=70998 RepID=UPI0012FAD5A6|nr:hypothetical protein [Neolewinella persica]
MEPRGNGQKYSGKYRNPNNGQTGKQGCLRRPGQPDANEVALQQARQPAEAENITDVE